MTAALQESRTPDLNREDALKELTILAWVAIETELTHEALAPGGLDAMHATLFKAGFGAALMILVEHVDHPLTARALAGSQALMPLDFVRASLGLAPDHRRVSKRPSHGLN